MFEIDSYTFPFLKPDRKDTQGRHQTKIDACDGFCHPLLEKNDVGMDFSSIICLFLSKIAILMNIFILLSPFNTERTPSNLQSYLHKLS